MVSKVFEVFMPNIEDHPNSDECVKQLTSFWKTNKDVLQKMSKEVPLLHEQVMANFKTAKEAAVKGKMPELT